jgi:ribonucleoside-triphosphate reductase
MYYHVVEDSQIGWAKSTARLLKELANGNDLTIDYSKIRPYGSPLKTKGGYASGPDILIQTHNFLRETLIAAQGRKLTPLEMHDMFCYALESGISGGTRRSAGMCIFDASDTEIATCKYDGFWNHPTHKVRANANNSSVWGENLSEFDVRDLTNQLFSTGTGEPGLFKRDVAIKTAPEWRNFIHPESIGTNPCGEIILQAIPVDSEVIKGGGWQFCNLSSINCREDDNYLSLYRKAMLATLMGDIQSLATDFQFLREGTKTICDQERLLGVNLVGHSTCPYVRENPGVVEEIRDFTVYFDTQFANDFKVPVSAALTSVKPSGNHMVLCHTGPGANVT